MSDPRFCFGRDMPEGWEWRTFDEGAPGSVWVHSGPPHPASVIQCRSRPTQSQFALALARALLTGTAAMGADLREMAAGDYTGRHSQAWLDGDRREGS